MAKRELELGVEPESGQHWKWQRAGWALIALVLAAAFAGLFGGGPIATESVHSDDGTLQVEYERFTRLLSPSSVRVAVGPAATAGGELRLFINRDYFRRASLEHVTPHPSSTEISADELIFAFAARKGESAEVAFDFRSTSPGSAHLSVRLPDGAPLRVRQIVFP